MVDHDLSDYFNINDIYIVQRLYNYITTFRDFLDFYFLTRSVLRSVLLGYLKYATDYFNNTIVQKRKRRTGKIVLSITVLHSLKKCRL